MLHMAVKEVLLNPFKNLSWFLRTQSKALATSLEIFPAIWSNLSFPTHAFHCSPD
jgi:hypothetical protein